MHVKYESNRSITTMGTVCNDPHLEKTRGETEIKQRELEPP